MAVAGREEQQGRRSGALMKGGDGRYSGQLTWAVNQNITVGTSDDGGEVEVGAEQDSILPLRALTRTRR